MTVQEHLESGCEYKPVLSAYTCCVSLNSRHDRCSVSGNVDTARLKAQCHNMKERVFTGPQSALWGMILLFMMSSFESLELAVVESRR